MGNIAAGHAMLQFCIVVLVLRAFITSICASAGKAGSRTETASMWLQGLVDTKVSIFAGDAVGAIFAGETVRGTEGAAGLVIEVAGHALFAEGIVVTLFAVG